MGGGEKIVRPRQRNREELRSKSVVSLITSEEKRIFTEVCRGEKKTESQLLRELIEQKINTIKLK